MPEWLQVWLATPILGTALRLLLLSLLFFFARYSLSVAVGQADRRIERQVDELDRRSRLQTLLRVGYHVVVVVLGVIALTMALQLFNINVVPVVASAGVVGLAVSLGAQTLIRDYIGGILILTEDQFRVGDTIEVSGVSGEVVRMTLRATYLRNTEGKQYTVPNGDVRLIANLTRDWSRAVVDLNLEFGADFERALRALEGAAARAQEDPGLQEMLLGEPEVVSWNGTGNGAVQVRLMAKTRPGRQWEVARGLRRLAAEALRREGIKGNW